jgi:hypothetical protein
MQIPHLGKLAFAKKHITRFIICKLGKNKIGIESCKLLSQANWPCLMNLNLLANSIGAKELG